jgi:hypothetical protein
LENLNRIELMAAYGLSYGSGPKKLARLIAGINAAMKVRPKLFKGPVVIPLLSSFSEKEWLDFNEALKILPLREYSVKIRPTFDPEIAEVIRALRKKEILIMPVGAVTQNVWNTLMEKSTLPPTIAGTSGRNFMNHQGRPYFNTLGPLSLIQYEELLESEANQLITRAHEAMTNGISTTTPFEGGHIEYVAEYILQSKDKASAISMSFKRRAQEWKARPDKVSSVLRESKIFFEQHLEINSQPPLQPEPLTTEHEEDLATLQRILNRTFGKPPQKDRCLQHHISAEVKKMMD